MNKAIDCLEHEETVDFDNRCATTEFWSELRKEEKLLRDYEKKMEGDKE